MSTAKARSAGAAAFALSVTFGIVALLAEQPAAARDLTVTAPIRSEALTELVSVADLDLAQARDLQQLGYRIRAASRNVCEPLSIGKASVPENRCRAVALNSAAPQVARLADRARQLAAAGLPSRIASTISVVARSE